MAWLEWLELSNGWSTLTQRRMAESCELREARSFFFWQTGSQDRRKPRTQKPAERLMSLFTKKQEQLTWPWKCSKSKRQSQTVGNGKGQPSRRWGGWGRGSPQGKNTRHTHGKSQRREQARERCRCRFFHGPFQRMNIGIVSSASNEASVDGVATISMTTNNPGSPPCPAKDQNASDVRPP